MASHKSKTGTKINVTKAVKESSPVDEYVTPGGYELEKILNRGSVAYTHVNEVWPNVYIGDEQTAKDKCNLKRLGITHILNAAEGTWNNVDTGAGYYGDMDVVYCGVVAEDITTFNLSQYFFSAARFIEETLSNPQNKLLVHCVMGRSRSASLFLAFLMICENMTVVDAIEHVKRRRRIVPNWGFLKQLRELDMQLLEKREGWRPSGGAKLSLRSMETNSSRVPSHRKGKKRQDKSKKTKLWPTLKQFETHLSQVKISSHTRAKSK